MIRKVQFFKALEKSNRYLKLAMKYKKKSYFLFIYYYRKHLKEELILAKYNVQECKKLIPLTK